MAAEIVDDDDIARFARWNENLLLPRGEPTSHLKWITPSEGGL